MMGDGVILVSPSALDTAGQNSKRIAKGHPGQGGRGAAGNSTGSKSISIIPFQ